ncbi:MAG TPA: hypothetical protein VMR25_15730, partial [Planctomycetaceae bacterium]|nr:hypothetical protein [Planctomycetaceae bacterium]
MNVFSLDTFVGTAPAANLTGHTGQLGATWSLVTGTSPVFTSTGYVRAAASGAAPVAASGTPGTADYDAEIVLISITLDSYAEIAIDINAGSDNYYSVGYGPRTSGTPANGGILEVVKVTAGTRSVLASLNVNLTVSQPYFLRASRRHTATGTILNL